MISSLKKLTCCLLLFSGYAIAHAQTTDSTFYSGTNSNIRYIGRSYTTNTSNPRFWAPGAYVIIKFSGTTGTLSINDEQRYGTSHNYIEIQVDNQPAYRLQLKNKENHIPVAQGLAAGTHTVVICKDTEAENGYIEIAGFTCRKLLPPPAPKKRKIEFIGDSITCGFGADESAIACGKGTWYDEHNAWMAYGPTTARRLNAQWHLTAQSGIGLIHSCCNKTILMPAIYNKVDISPTGPTWDFTQFQPDAVTICLGQNDGVQDSVKFCTAYVAFAQTLRSYYPKAKLIFLTSPMANKQLNTVLQKYTVAVKENLIAGGDKNVGNYFFSKQYNHGCATHPSLQEQQAMAAELTGYLKTLMHW